MKITGFFIAFILFVSCQEKEVLPQASETNYNLNANKLIEQVIINDSISDRCLLEFSEKSLIQSREQDMPLHAKSLKKNIMNELGITSEEKLEKQERQSDNFIFDLGILERNNISLVNQETLLAAKNNIKICSKGIVIIHKPIFDKNFTTAVIIVDFAFTCIPGLIQTYKFQKGKWVSH